MEDEDLDILKQVVEALTEIQEDNTVPRNIKERIKNVRFILDEDTEMSIKINKSLHELEEISEDTNILPFTRTQIINISSLLESALIEN